MAFKKHTMSVATVAAIAAVGVLSFAPLASAAPYPGATTSPGTVLLPTVKPVFNIDGGITSLISTIFGTKPSVVANETADVPPPVDTTRPVGSIANPVDLSNANQSVTLPIGSEEYFSYSFGPSAANQVINTVIVLPGGETVEVVAHTDANGRIEFKATVSDPHISINGSVPIPAHYGANTVTLAATYKGAVVTQNLAINVPQSASGGGTPSTIAGGTTTSTGKPFIAEGLGIFALVVVGGALVAFGVRRRTKTGESV